MDPNILPFDDASCAILGLAYSLVTGSFFQVVLKKSIGGFRPYFLSVCEPAVPENGSAARGSGFQSVMYTSNVCTGNPDKIQNAMESFPLGHAEIAFAGLFYLSIYLNAQLRVFSSSATFLSRRQLRKGEEGQGEEDIKDRSSENAGNEILPTSRPGTGSMV